MADSTADVISTETFIARATAALGVEQLLVSAGKDRPIATERTRQALLIGCMPAKHVLSRRARRYRPLI